MYDVSKYTDEELYAILDINNPTDRELEAKILSMVYKYNTIGNDSSAKLVQFFVDIYSHFFEEDGDEQEESAVSQNVVEGFGTSIQFTGNVNSSSISTGNTTAQQAPANTQLTKTLAYSSDKLNPLLNQTIKRVISIDSQYRDNKLQTPTTNFTFNLSEPLKDVVSLKLYSVQIPYSWYTVNSTFGGNFFYLKGSSLGIDNETFYYKIGIPSGNYTPDTLISAINYDISTNLIPLHTDVNFGQTQLYYNNSTGLVTFNIDIKNVFGESNYQLKFPDWTSVTNVNIADVSTNRFASLASYMGFNNTTYSCSSTDSSTIYNLSTNDTAIFPATFDANTFKFYVYPYLGNAYTSASAIYTPIQVTLPNTITTNASRLEYISLLNTTLKSNTYFDHIYSGVKWIDFDTSGQYAQGFSYLNMAIKVFPNINIAPIVPNMNYAVVFPDSSNSVFHGPRSVFQFQTTNRDSSKNVVCELNNLIADAPILQSNYDISEINQLRFTCDASGYSDASNTFIVDVPTFRNYTLSQYINAVQSAITATAITSSDISGTTFKQDSSLNIVLNVVINQTFTNKNYKIQAYGQIADIFGMYNTNSDGTHRYDLSKNLTEPTQDFSNNYLLNIITLTSNDKLVIFPIPGVYNNKNADAFVVDFSNSAVSYSSIDLLVLHLNATLINYTDTILKTRPFAYSSIYYDYANSRFVLRVDVDQRLTQNNYLLEMYSTDVSNNWITKLKFDASYNLSNYDKNNGSNSIVTNNTPISDQQITILPTQKNNYLELIPYSNIIGLQTPTNLYSVKVTIPARSYSMYQLVTYINTQLEANPLTVGSQFSIVLINGQNYVQFRSNINKVFGTSDYRIAFYDPLSFVSCYSGATRIGNSSIQNVTWDTTVGWLLGYRQSTIYYLSDYVGINLTSSTNPQNYYLTGDSSNVFIMVSDTAVSTNLYNYFLILLDDFVQNHLNDGLVTITNQETSVEIPPVKYVCDPVSQQMTAVPADYGNPGVSYTANQLYSFNQKVLSQQVIQKSYSSGPFVKDIFGIVPLKVSGMSVGSVYVEFGGTLQNQDRIYFGPVNISRMKIQLLTDRGDVVDLNNANWSFSLMCEQLYTSS
jgi:hypothetical protein